VNLRKDHYLKRLSSESNKDVVSRIKKKKKKKLTTYVFLFFPFFFLFFV
jgi:hypothetical protein